MKADCREGPRNVRTASYCTISEYKCPSSLARTHTFFLMGQVQFRCGCTFLESFGASKFPLKHVRCLTNEASATLSTGLAKALRPLFSR